MALAGLRHCLLCWLLCALPCCSLRLGEPGGSALGEQLGGKLLAADDEVAADASQNGGKSTFQRSYADTLTSKETVLVNPAVSKVLQQANGLAQSLVEKDGLCERRWASECPDGWTLTGDGQCAAPTSYGGSCKKVQSFNALSAAARQRTAEECKAPWPCEDACSGGHDYSELCPEGWHDDGTGFCEAPAGFDTKCATSYDFAEMDLRMRQELAQTCGFQWKCQGSCQQDFSKACPDEWQEVPMNPGMCMAPATYTGICSFSVNTTGMTADQKAAFARKCAVKFPCLGLGAAAAAGAGSHNAGPMPDGPVR